MNLLCSFWRDILKSRLTRLKPYSSSGYLGYQWILPPNLTGIVCLKRVWMPLWSSHMAFSCTFLIWQPCVFIIINVNWYAISVVMMINHVWLPQACDRNQHHWFLMGIGLEEAVCLFNKFLMCRWHGHHRIGPRLCRMLWQRGTEGLSSASSGMPK